nr:MAG TPA: TRAF PROTEIN, TRAO PROTEIN, TRAN ADHESION, BACTERIAL SECRETION.5A [Caudoviricetes sp.]
MKVLLCLLLAGCTSPQYLVQRHTCPAAPTLPIVLESELATLTGGVYVPAVPCPAAYLPGSANVAHRAGKRTGNADRRDLQDAGGTGVTVQRIYPAVGGVL